MQLLMTCPRSGVMVLDLQPAVLMLWHAAASVPACDHLCVRGVCACLYVVCKAESCDLIAADLNRCWSCLPCALPPFQEDVESETDNLSHADTVRTLRALCFLANNEKSHEDITQQVFPTLVLLLPHLLGVLSTVAESKLHKDKGQVKDTPATPTGELHGTLRV